MIQRGPQACDHHDVLAQAERPVGHRLRRRVGQHPRARLGEVAARGERAAEQRADELGLRRQRTHGARREQRTGRDPHEAVQNVPAGVHAGDLVRHELDAVHDGGGGQDEGMLQDLEVGGQVDGAGRAHPPEHERRGVEIDAARPAHAQGGGDDRDHFHGSTPLRSLE